MFRAIKAGFFKGYDIMYMYTDEDSGESTGYRAKLGINASGLASQEVAGGQGKTMGRDWVSCYFPADRKTEWNHFTRDLYNKDEVLLTVVLPRPYPCTVLTHLLQEGGWSICETKEAKAAFKRLQEGGVPNKAVDSFFNETKHKAKAAAKAKAANAAKRKR